MLARFTKPEHTEARKPPCPDYSRKPSVSPTLEARAGKHVPYGHFPNASKTSRAHLALWNCGGKLLSLGSDSLVLCGSSLSWPGLLEASLPVPLKTGVAGGPLERPWKVYYSVPAVLTGMSVGRPGAPKVVCIVSLCLQE